MRDARIRLAGRLSQDKKETSMVFKITSRRGHHEVDIAEPEVCEALFNKLTGKTNAPLPEEFKGKVPDTFQELQGLWRKGNLAYVATTVDKGMDAANNSRLVTKFDPQLKDVVFLDMISGG